MNITFAKPSYPQVGAYVVLAWEGTGLTKGIETLNRKTRGSIKRAMASEKFMGKEGQVLILLAPVGLRAERIVLVGMGKSERFDPSKAQKSGR